MSLAHAICEALYRWDGAGNLHAPLLLALTCPTSASSCAASGPKRSHVQCFSLAIIALAASLSRSAFARLAA